MAKKDKNKRRKPKAKNGQCTPVYRESKGCFELRISYTDINGKTKRKSFSAQSAHECEAKKEKFLAELDKEKNGILLYSTLPEVLRFENERRLRKNKQKEQGYGRNEDTIKYIEKSSIGRIPIKDITVNQLDFFLCEITRYSNDTISKIYEKVIKAFELAYRKKIIDNNPFYDERNDLDKPKSNKATKVIVPLEVEEQKMFEEAVVSYSKEKKACNKYHHQLMIELYSGMRMGEINALTPDDVDFEKNEIRITKTITRDRNKKPILSQTPKTEASRRTIEMLPQVREHLMEAIHEMIPNPNNLIFCNKKNKGLITTQNVNSAYRRIRKNMGVREEDIQGQHQLRHTYGTRCVEAGMQYEVLRDLLGHSSIKITMDTYAGVLAPHREKNIQKVNDYMNRIHE